MNDAIMNFSGMRETARQILSFATLLRISADDCDAIMLDDVAAAIQEKAAQLGGMIEAAQAAAADIQA